MLLFICQQGLEHTVRTRAQLCVLCIELGLSVGMFAQLAHVAPFVAVCRRFRPDPNGSVQERGLESLACVRSHKVRH